MKKTMDITYLDEYREGDEVIIKTVKEMEEVEEKEGNSCILMHDMREYAEKGATIIEIDEDGDLTLDVDGEWFSWSPYYVRLITADDHRRF